MKYDCLIIDDEEVLANSTAEYFNLFGVKTAAVYDTNGFLDFFSKNTAKLVLLDINLGQNQSGFDICRKIRENNDIPILFISARTSDDDKIFALEYGGDDYIQKPYSLGVLLAKVKAVLKRYGSSSAEFKDGYLHVNFAAKQVFVNGREVKLTALEFRLLAYLIERRGKVISKRELFENVWQDKFTGDGTLNVHIRRIREAIEENANSPRYIITVWGEGYKFAGEKP